MRGDGAGSDSRHVAVCAVLRVVALEVFAMSEAWPVAPGPAATLMLVPLDLPNFSRVMFFSSLSVLSFLFFICLSIYR